MLILNLCEPSVTPHSHDKEHRLAVDGVTVSTTWQPSPQTWPIPEGDSATTFLLMTGMVQSTEHTITVTEATADKSTRAQTETVIVY